MGYLVGQRISAIVVEFLSDPDAHCDAHANPCSIAHRHSDYDADAWSDSDAAHDHDFDVTLRKDGRCVLRIYSGQGRHDSLQLLGQFRLAAAGNFSGEQHRRAVWDADKGWEILVRGNGNRHRRHNLVEKLPTEDRDKKIAQ